MHPSLNNFKKEIASHILQRGRDYYDGGNILSLEEIGDGHWSAEVEGTQLYTVEIAQLEGERIYHTCTCPYDWGPTCKHVAAVLYAIEDTFQEYLDGKPKIPRKKRSSRKEKWSGVVEDLLENLEDRSWGNHAQAEIYVCEAMWEQLLEIAMRLGEHYLKSYRQYLEPRFPDEIFNAYQQIVYQKLSHTSKRAIYAEAAKYLVKMNKMGYGLEAREIKKDLILKYNRRRAMIEELNAALPG